ncbi:heavy metal translocatin [Rhizodiscina lignyota]|uniref:Heavy metal translocatin n=1 Tax=Rhizodiscina lignyota TaxID=1504668 RepID=A0A9P4I7J7_9PEZI|nr:heavy metal translocatin [Rhizodiscina lignyota]
MEKEASRVSESATAPLESVEAASPTNQHFQAIFSITGMTCSACVRAITERLETEPVVLKANVVLLASSATVDFSGEGHAGDLAELIEELGYGAVIEEVKPILDHEQKFGKGKQKAQLWKAIISMEGIMDTTTDEAIKTALQEHPSISRTSISPEEHEPRVVVEISDRKSLPEILEVINSTSGHYGAVLLDLVQVDAQTDASDQELYPRSVSVQVQGGLDERKKEQIYDALADFKGCILVDTQTLSTTNTILNIEYTPRVPNFTIRNIVVTVKSVDPLFAVNIYHPLTLEERVRLMHIRERRNIIYRVVLSVIAAIPSFIIGIALMSLVPRNNAARMYLTRPWANVSRAQWALLIIATPVYFLAADMFHRRALKELIALWRPGSSTPLFRRFYRFGSMNLLMSLGTSIAYFSSIAEIIIASQKPFVANISNSSFYFDSVVFLTMFLLIGRLIEAWSRAKTADAVTSLGQLRPTTANLCSTVRFDKANSAPIQKVPVDMIESGDVIMIAHGASPPCDGFIVDGSGSFDESSLTGESRLITKTIGDDIFSGTVNKGSPILMRVTKIVGSSMLDQIIQVVRDGQARRAPVERIGDILTSYFVPVITVISITTWILWLALGESRTLPRDWLDVESGGWPYWSLQFSVAVFIIACPCGFGLAAPTALFVGGGIAAKNGILAKGGGEAFQEASYIDIVVFDKTGTLTDGGKPAVTEIEYLQNSGSNQLDQKLLHSLVQAIEEKSNHPIASALVTYVSGKDRVKVNATFIDELPGRGMKGLFGSDEYPDSSFMVLLGNEKLLSENDVEIPDSAAETLDSWKRQGKSIVLIAIRVTDLPSSTVGDWSLQLMFAISDPIKPESIGVIKALKEQGIGVWMISGDNPTTASAVGQTVGIPPDKVIAGVLPEQKAEKIQYLQRSQAKQKQGWFSERKSGGGRATVAMVGDGVNDSPALTVADVGIAIGSGSDVAISSADFVLVSSDLSTVLVLLQLSRAVFRRIKFNFGWALVYNIIALPIAAGALYPVRSNGSHVRLDPVWASLAMALSSISVVSSSLALKTKLPLVGFRRPAIRIERS